MCNDCIFWVKDVKVAGIGSCHCNPPTADYRWPLTAPSDWCGEYVKDLPPPARK